MEYNTIIPISLKRFLLLNFRIKLSQGIELQNDLNHVEDSEIRQEMND